MNTSLNQKDQQGLQVKPKLRVIYLAFSLCSSEPSDINSHEQFLLHLRKAADFGENRL